MRTRCVNWHGGAEGAADRGDRGLAACEDVLARGRREPCDDGGKKATGRKRHLVVDILGLLLVVCVTTAAPRDRDVAVPRQSPCRQIHGP